MIKLYVFLAAPPDVDPFRHRGAAALSELHSVVPEAVEYVQTRMLDRQLTDEPPPYAGAAEFRFDYAAHALDAAARSADLARLWADGVSASALVAGHERTIMRMPEHVPGEGVKAVFPFNRKPGLSVEYFQHYWWRNHSPIAARTESALAYLQCHPLRHLYDDGAPDFDGVTELHWPDFAAAEAAMASRQMREDQSQDAQKFVDMDTTLMLMAVEEVVQP